MPAAMESDAAMREALVSRIDGPITFHAEPLSAMETLQVENEEARIQELRARYSGLQVDLVIAASSVALRFVVQHRAAIWPRSPVVYYLVAGHALVNIALPSDIAGVAVPFDFDGTLALAVRLQPDASKVVYIAGVAPYDEVWSPMFDRAMQRYRGRLAQRKLVGLPLAQLERELAGTREDTIVLLTSVFRDAEGGRYSPAAVARTLAHELQVPLYAVHGGYMGSGVLGGSMVDPAAHGRQAGELAARVLNREVGYSPRVASLPSCTVDARQMKRWRLPMRRLPQRCSVLLGDAPEWQANRGTLLVAAVTLAALTLLTLALARQKRHRKAAEGEALERRSEVAHAARLALVGEITASVVHEVAQPLGAILNNADAARMLLDTTDPDLDEMRQIMEEIRSDNLRACEIVRKVRQLLTKGVQETVPMDLNQVANSVVTLTRPDALRRRVTVRSKLDPTLPRVIGDPVQLQQVLLNLMINAMDEMEAIPAGERLLDVCTSLCGQGFATVAVIDSGRGIDAQALTKLFDSFFTTKHDGLGLGLSIARAIVEAHGGAIWAENNAPRGAVLRFTVPLCAPLPERSPGPR